VGAVKEVHRHLCRGYTDTARRYPTSTLQRPCPTPAVAAVQSGVGGAPLLTTNHPSDVLCLLPRRIKRVRVSIASPFAQLSQNGRRAGIRIDTFEMLLRLYSRYGPSDRSATQGDLCHEASSRLICI